MYKCETSFFGWRESHLLNNDDLLQKVFQRLPYKLKSQFVSIVDKGSGTFTQLRELVENAVSEADTAYGQFLSQGNVRRSNNNQGVINNVCKCTCVAQQHLAPIKPAVEPPLCVLCSENHEIRKCAVFESKSIKERLSLAQTLKLCFNCIECLNANGRFSVKSVASGTICYCTRTSKTKQIFPDRKTRKKTWPVVLLATIVHLHFLAEQSLSSFQLRCGTTTHQNIFAPMRLLTRDQV